MEDWQKRVIIEQKELSEKIIALTKFITNNTKIKSIDETSWNYLNKQLEIMLDYNRILLMRIKLFK